MKKLIFITLLLIVGNSISAQITFNKSYHNFGEVNKEDQKYFDFTLTNAGTTTAHLLRIEEPYGVDVKFSQKEIAPDSTIIVRIKYTPKKKGKFKKDIPVWVSVNNEPITFTIEGNAKTFDVNESLKCPNFKTSKKPIDLRADLKVSVIDINTKQPIKNAIIEIIWDGLVYKKLATTKKGEATQNLKYDMYYFVVNAEGYGTQEKAFYVNNKNNTLTFELGEPTKEELIVEEKDSIIADPIVVIIEPKDTISTTDLPVNLYAPNNVVFLIDVSVSMKQEGRLDLLKASMIELLNGLRPIDKLAIVTYATSTTVVLKSDYVTDKAMIIELIQELKAGGYTSSGKGVRKAYQVARANKIENGNNQVILATDGAIILNGNTIIEDVAANLEKGITMSVLGVKNRKTTVKSMSKIAKTGNGNYIQIKSYAQAKSVLMDEIKDNSKIK